MDNIFGALAAAESALNIARDVQGRSMSLCLGIIANTADPYGIGRVQVTLSAHGGKSLSPWYQRMVPLDNLYPPDLLIGRTAVCGYIDGNPNIGVVLGVLVNDVNKLQEPQPQNFNYYVGQTSICLEPDNGVTIKVGNSMVVVITPDTVKICGKDVTTLGAKDTSNDTLITKGYSAT